MSIFSRIMARQIAGGGFSQSRYDHYAEVYDTLTEILEEYFEGQNCGVCDFDDNDKCKSNREENLKHKTMGCCYSFHESHGGFITTPTILCPWVEGRKSCANQCIPCLTYFCDFICKAKGVKRIRLKNIAYAKKNLNKKQIHILEQNLFCTRDALIRKVMTAENNLIPTFFYNNTRDMYMIQFKDPTLEEVEAELKAKEERKAARISRKSQNLSAEENSNSEITKN